MTQAKKVRIVLLLNLIMVGGLVAVGETSHSLGVIAAAGDYVADIAGLVLGLVAIQWRTRRGETSRATTYVAILNSFALFLVCAWVAIESIARLARGNPEIHAVPVLWVSLIAAILMGVGALVLEGDDDLHMKSLFLDAIADAASAGLVALSGLIIYLANGLNWLDSLSALVVSLVIAFQARKLLREAFGQLSRGVRT